MQPVQPGPGQESVWNYPRPPALEPCDLLLEVVFEGGVVASTRQGLRVLETSHPPTYYFPPGDVDRRYLLLESHRSFCEWKGIASYYGVGSLADEGQRSQRVLSQVAWSYGEPTPAFLPLKDYVAFYAEPFYALSGSGDDGCYVGGERVQPQPGNFYGGWITSNILGPFKGIPGSWGW